MEVKISGGTLDCAELVLPKGVAVLLIDDSCKVSNISSLEIPLSVDTLAIENCYPDTLDDFVVPDHLKFLYIGHLGLTQLDLKFGPDSLLRVLDLDGNPFQGIEHTHFPESLREIWFFHPLGRLDGVYVSPKAKLSGIKCSEELRFASDQTCARTIFRARPGSPFPSGAWWARVSYQLGGVAWEEVDGAF